MDYVLKAVTPEYLEEALRVEQGAMGNHCYLGDVYEYYLTTTGELTGVFVDGKLVGIGKFHLRADRAEIIGRNRALDRRHRADIHENRRLDGSVDRFHFRAFCAAIFV